jgi:hypothetical protein
MEYGAPKYTAPTTPPVSRHTYVHPSSQGQATHPFSGLSDFKRGNLINIGFAGVAFVLWLAQKAAYRMRNARNAATVARMGEAERAKEEELRAEKGNRGPLFRFTT